ncbi:MAG: alpha-glucosidase C-terminal domain-containing protein, partial [Anaerolineaceae bacterium]|nr:alpha-glucosidase C-terminal domain-containing protein [Anaerolineaceae bacterium]
KLLKLRKNTPALQQGMFVPLTYDPQQVMGYLRQVEGQTVLVALNFGKRKIKLALGPRLNDAKWELLLSNKRDALPKIEKGWLHLSGDEACILQLV